ncbi:MAG TPA: peptidoglycan-binding domain-containing protein [Terriglobales bacterium]|nr:peptidoglycan-binding domain-containing protein [Terriglobales bacterium]
MRPICAYIGRLSIAALALAAVLCFAAGTESATSTPQKTTAKSSAHHSTKSSHSSRKGKKSKTSASRKKGQQKIDSERATQIQEALIREHYLTGKVTGNWDAATQQAMQKFQADNGWQSKTTPDSRALIKLGLGPDQQHLLNPESAMTSAPQAGHPIAPPSKTTDPSDPARPQSQ